MLRLIFSWYFFMMLFVCLNGQTNIDSLLQIAKSDQADSIRFDAYYELTFYYASRDTALAYHYIKDLKILAERTKIKNADIKIYNRLGNLSQMNGDYDKSIDLYRKGISLISDSANIARFYGGIGSSYYFKNMLDSCEYYLYKGYDLKTRWDADDPISLIRSLVNLGVLCEQQNKYVKAIQYYQEALELSINNNNERQISVIYNNIGTAYASLDEWEKAFGYFQKSYKIAKKIEDSRTIGNSTTNLGNYFSVSNKKQEAIKYYREAIESFKKVGHNFDLANTYHTYAENYLEMDEPEKALPVLLRGYALADSIDAKGTLIRICVNLSKLKLEESNLSQSRRYIDKALLEVESHEDIEVKRTVFKQASLVYAELKQEAKALEFYKIYSSTQDSIDAGRHNKEVKELNIKYETKERENKINAQNLEIEKKTKERNLYLLGMCLLGLMGFLIVNRKTLQQKIAEEKLYNLEQKQKLIAIDNIMQGQEEERKRIAKDLHDGLGGLLTSASLQMQKINNEIKNFENLQFVKRAENLIDTASAELRRIAHDMMPDALVNLGLKSAILDLSHEINETSNIKVDTYFSHEEFLLEDKLQVAIYRIVQELTHNAVKYSKASNLLIQLMDTGANYELTVEDNGVGFDFEEAKNMSGMGLQNLETRLNYLDAKFQFDNKNGASYLIRIPKNTN